MNYEFEQWCDTIESICFFSIRAQQFIGLNKLLYDADIHSIEIAEQMKELKASCKCTANGICCLFCFLRSEKWFVTIMTRVISIDFGLLSR